MKQEMLEILKQANAGSTEATLFSIWEERMRLLNLSAGQANTVWTKKCRSNYFMLREGPIKTRKVQRQLANLSNVSTLSTKIKTMNSISVHCFTWQKINKFKNSTQMQLTLLLKYCNLIAMISVSTNREGKTTYLMKTMTKHSGTSRHQQHLTRITQMFIT